MSKIDELRIAVMHWHQAHSAVMDFFERNDILDARSNELWAQLRNAEDEARVEVEDMIKAALREDRGP